MLMAWVDFLMNLQTALRYFSNGLGDAAYSLTDEEVLAAYRSRITNVSLDEQKQCEASSLGDWGSKKQRITFTSRLRQYV